MHWGPPVLSESSPMRPSFKLLRGNVNPRSAETKPLYHGIPKPLKSQKPIVKNDLFKKKESNFSKSAISGTVPNQHTIKMLWTSWMRHLWHFDRIQSTSLFYLRIVRNVSSIATIEFDAMIHAKGPKKHTSAHCARTPTDYQKPIFFGWSLTGFYG